MLFVIARSKAHRPTLMHVVGAAGTYTTLCGLDISYWSRAYFDQPIPRVECLRCKMMRGKEG